MNGLKKIFNVLLILIGVVLIVLCVDLVTNKAVNTSFENLEELDQNAVSDVCDIVSLFDSRKGNKQIWDVNYNPRKQGCIVVSQSTGRAYAINLDMSGYAYTQKIEMPDDYSDIMLYRFSSFSPRSIALRFSNDSLGYIEIKNEDIMYIKYNENMVNLNGNSSLKETYVKQTFQDAMESPDRPVAENTMSFAMDEENIALTGLQYRIIDDMRNVGSKNELNELVAEYVIIRDYQQRLYPEFSDYQQRVELNEGRAQYVFYKISDLTGDDMSYFNKPKSEEITFYSAYHYLCTGKYNDDVSEFLDHKGNVYVGAVLCEILDNNRISSEWEYKLDNSSNADFRSQYTLIQNYCKKRCGEYTKDKTVDSIKTAYNYEEILEMAKALVKGNAEQQ